MSLTLITAPSVDPITLAEAKSHLRVTAADEDTLITSLIKAATAYVDGANGMLGRALVTQTWDYKLDAFPCAAIKPPLPPLQSVTHVKYIDTDGVEQTVDAADYRVVPGGEWFPLVEPAYGKNWPTARRISDAVTVRIVVGYGLAAAVPAPIKAALLLIVGHLFEHREENADFPVHAMPLGAERLLANYRVAW